MDGNYLERPVNEQVIIDEVIRKRNALYNIIRQTRNLEIHEKIVSISQALVKKYPDAQQCYLYHVMIQSTIDRNKCSKFDFPGDDSVVKKLGDLYEEYQPE